MPYVLCTIPILFHQWTLQAARMDLMGLTAEQVGVINPVLILMFVPLFEGCIYPWLRKYLFDPTPLRRMAFGMLITAAAFAVSAYLEAQIESATTNNAPKIVVAWQLPQLLLITVAEIFVSITGLEFAYSQAPRELKGTVMSLFLITTSIGDLLTGVTYDGVTAMGFKSQSQVFYFFAVAMLVNFFIFLAIACRFPGGGLAANGHYEPYKSTHVSPIGSAALHQHGDDEDDDNVDEKVQSEQGNVNAGMVDNNGLHARSKPSLRGKDENQVLLRTKSLA